jgi:hypothetical protein
MLPPSVLIRHIVRQCVPFPLSLQGIVFEAGTASIGIEADTAGIGIEADTAGIGIGGYWCSQIICRKAGKMPGES